MGFACMINAESEGMKCFPTSNTFLAIIAAMPSMHYL